MCFFHRKFCIKNYEEHLRHHRQILIELSRNAPYVHGENFMAIFTTLSIVIFFSMGTLGIFATLVYVFAIRVVIGDILSIAIILYTICATYYCEFHHAV